jgi:hypothetical protein
MAERSRIVNCRKLPLEGVAGVQREFMEVSRRKIGPQVGTVTPDQAVLHQRILQEDLLARLDVPAGENRLAARADDLSRNRGGHVDRP